MTLLQDHELDCDILVAGGGPAGVPCAIAAARSGARVILCQDRCVLGGNASSEVRMHIVGANGPGVLDRGEELKTEAREGGIIEEIRLENCVRNPQRSASMFDLILYEKCRAEPNLTLMLNTSVTGVEMEGKRIVRALAERQSTEDRFRVRAKVFVDCTGDGRLGVEARAEFMEGRDDKSRFGETLALDQADNHRLGSTLLMQARKHDQPMPFTPPDWARRFSKKDLRLRLYAVPGEEEPTHEYGYWWAEWGGTLDTVRDNETIRDELLAILMGIWDHIKNGPPGTPSGEDPFKASNWALDWFGFLPGKRESRRFVGKHILTESDVLSSKFFADAIAYGGWPLDLHPPEGVDAPDQEPCVQTPVPYLYDIPLRCCLSKNISNLSFAGRNLSASHVAFSSTRVMATCATVGQGLGTALAYATKHELEAGELPNNPEALFEIQQQLLRDDAFLIGRSNEDPRDLVRAATAIANSEIKGSPAGLVLSGATRCTHGHKGSPPDRRTDSNHRWMSDPAEGFPAILTLEWEAPIRVSEIRLVFDTGMHRHLTLSHHDGYTSKMKWGIPQPETVRDYTIDGFDGVEWVGLVEVNGNYHRLRVHPIDMDLSFLKVRILVNATNGIDHARICEVRVY